VIARSAVLSARALAQAACGGDGSTLSAPTALPAPPPRPGPAAAVPAPDEEDTALAPVSYDAKGRRDPFAVLEVTGGAKGLTVSSTKLAGIVHSQRGTYALLEGSDGIGYILRAGDTLGDGRLLEIGADSAIFSVVPRPGAPPNRVTLRLRTDS
jgi:hypothetical protein